MSQPNQDAACLPPELAAKLFQIDHGRNALQHPMIVFRACMYWPRA